MKRDEPEVIEIYVDDERGPGAWENARVPGWLALAGAIAFGLAVVWMVYIVCMDLLPYALRML